MNTFSVLIHIKKVLLNAVFAFIAGLVATSVINFGAYATLFLVCMAVYGALGGSVNDIFSFLAAKKAALVDNGDKANPKE